MEHKQNVAKYVFFYLLALVGLVFTSLSSGIAVFQIINKFIVDAGASYGGQFSNEAIKFAISAIIVAAPIFYVTTKFIYQGLAQGELSKDSGLRRWLTYFILFVSAMIVLGWMIAVVNNFLDGEITLKFLLKALTVMTIAVSIFGFYFYDIKRKSASYKDDNVLKYFFAISVVVLVAIFVASLFVMESPRETRDKRLDQAVLNSFSSIDSCVSDYYQKNTNLPENIEILKDNCPYFLDDILVDRETQKSLEYKIVDDKNYELCAEFRTSNKDEEENNYYNMLEKRKSYLHDIGWQCLVREVEIINIEKELFPLSR